MTKPLDDYTDREAEGVMLNAKGKDDALWWRMFRHRAKLAGRACPEGGQPVVARFYEILAAYEMLLPGKRAHRVRQGHAGADRRAGGAGFPDVLFGEGQSEREGAAAMTKIGECGPVNWDYGPSRQALLDRVGPVEFERLREAHEERDVVARVNGRAVRRAPGRLPRFSVEGVVFFTRREAETIR